MSRRPTYGYLGIDPGNSGAFARINAAGGFEALADMPIVKTGGKKRIDEVKLYDLLEEFALMAVPVLEKVGGLPRQSAPRAFVFGEGYGLIRGMLATLSRLYPDRYPIYHLATPQAWKGKILPGTSKDKGAAILEARRRFSVALDMLRAKTCDGRAEALLIAEYGRLTY